MVWRQCSRLHKAATRLGNPRSRGWSLRQEWRRPRHRSPEAHRKPPRCRAGPSTRARSPRPADAPEETKHDMVASMALPNRPCSDPDGPRHRTCLVRRTARECRRRRPLRSPGQSLVFTGVPATALDTAYRGGSRMVSPVAATVDAAAGSCPGAGMASARGARRTRTCANTVAPGRASAGGSAERTTHGRVRGRCAYAAADSGARGACSRAQHRACRPAARQLGRSGFSLDGQGRCRGACGQAGRRAAAAVRRRSRGGARGAEAVGGRTAAPGIAERHPRVAHAPQPRANRRPPCAG